MRSRRISLLAVMILAASCGSQGEDNASRPTTSFPPEFTSALCEIRIHGRTDQGAAPRRADGYVVVSPDANEAFEQGGRVWVYDSPGTFKAARARVETAIDEAGCSKAVLHGFSNGAAFAAKLACSGETFDGRLAGVVVDDPVTDNSSPDCEPDGGVPIVVYWTGSLPDEGSCQELGWTCAGGDELVGIEGFAERLGASVEASPESEHVIFDDPPEIRQWLNVN